MPSSRSSVRGRGRGAAPCETSRVAAAAASARVGLQVDEPCYATPGVRSGAVAMPLVAARALGFRWSGKGDRLTGEMAPAAAPSPSPVSGMPLTRDSWREIYHPGYFSCSSPSDLVTPGGGFTERVMISQAFFHSIKCYPFPGQHHRCTQHPRQPTGSRTGIHHRLP